MHTSNGEDTTQTILGSLRGDVRARLDTIAGELAPKHGMTRRQFLGSSAGMAALFVAMNDVHGQIFDATRAEAKSPGAADAKSAGRMKQFIIDCYTYCLRDDLSPEQKARRGDAAKASQFDSYRRNMFFDSDTMVTAVSAGTQEDPDEMTSTSASVISVRNRINAEAGTQRVFSNVLFAPGRPGWLDGLDAALALKPDGVKGQTEGNPSGSQTVARSKWPWRLDGKDAYKGYEKLVAAGVKNICIHKGCFPSSLERIVPDTRGYADVADVGQAAKDWPQLNFLIYHAAFRHRGLGEAEDRKLLAVAFAEFERTGRISWTSDLADIPAQYGVTNVYTGVGKVLDYAFKYDPRVAAAVLGILIKGMGADHVCWGSSALWVGNPQWLIEAMRRIEIPEDMQKRHGFAPLGSADGPVKTAIFSTSGMRMFGISAQKRAAIENDKLSKLKADYLRTHQFPPAV